MGQFVAGDIVVINLPFSNLAVSKLRPALVVAPSGKEDYILCQITSKPYSSENIVVLSNNDLKAGSLPVTSYIRSDKLFTAEHTIITKKAATVKQEKLAEFQKALCKTLSLNT